MEQSSKTVHLHPEVHKKLKYLSLKNGSTIAEEVHKILSGAEVLKEVEV